ncbi:hypothetical protein [Absidia glauca]|uniref:SWIM-type domain-containing protein n=1 Tax=Absidia glauca TaxID=4829 RepID=A0A168ML37_ABSGL|nr:hypothetical protein [Absidia glauca]
MVIPDYMADCIKTGALFQSGVLTAAERRRRKLANNINADDASGMINSDVPGMVKVKSFDLEPDIIYDITLSEDENTMVACTCPSFTQSQTRCKHMFLVNRVHQILFPDIIHQQSSQGPTPTPTNNQQQTDPDGLSRALTILNTNNTRLQDLLSANNTYDDRAASNVLHAAELLTSAWSTLKHSLHPLRGSTHQRRF